MAGVTVLFGCAIARELGGRAFAQFLTALVIVLDPGLIGIAYGLSTEFLSPATWTALIYLTIRLVKTQNPRYYIWIALLVTLAFYAKYSIAGCALALAIGLLASGHGKLLRSAWLGYGVTLAVVLVLPNVLWQVAHGLPILEVVHNDQLNRHALANGMADESSDRWRNALYMFGLQFAYQNPVFAPIWIWGLVWFWRERQYRFVTVAYLILLGVLILTIGRGYYIQGCYPALFAAGAVAIERALAAKRRAPKIALAAAIVIAGLPMFPLSLPILSLPAYMAYERAIGLSRPGAARTARIISSIRCSPTSSAGRR